MPTKFRLTACLAMLFLCGCPLGTPRDHRRPHGHRDTTIAITPTDDAILFNAVGTGGRDLFMLQLADLSVVQLTDTPDYEVAPSFSPDGKLIVYAAGVPGERADHIFTITRDGNSKTQLTKEDANDTSPRFSPDGTLVVFARNKSYGWGGLAANWGSDSVICVVGADGTGERQLTPDDVYAFQPSFSQDAKYIIYSTDEGLFSIPVDGSNDAVKIGPPVKQSNLSPNAQKLVYTDGKYSPDHELFIANYDGTDRSQITKCDNGSFCPIFSNSGERVYFLTEEWPQGATGSSKSSIWTVNTDGTGQTQISDLSLFDDPMNWKPKHSP